MRFGDYTWSTENVTEPPKSNRGLEESQQAMYTEH